MFSDSAPESGTRGPAKPHHPDPAQERERPGNVMEEWEVERREGRMRKRKERRPTPRHTTERPAERKIKN